MRIENLDLRRRAGNLRASATVVWENAPLKPQEVFVETGPPWDRDLACEPHAFLVGALVPAMYRGERRIRVEGDVCPTLIEGLERVVGLMRFWSDGGWPPLVIEADRRSRPVRSNSRAGLFFSGGFDSLAALQLNRRSHPAGHPGRVRDCLLVHGFDIGGVVARGAKYQVFDRARRRLAPVAEDAGVEMIPAYTNLRHLCDERELWLERFFGAVLAAVGHAFAPRLDRVYIGSSFDYPVLSPCGSHPLLDPEYSSTELRVIHRDHHLSRQEKLRVVAGWPAAFQNFRVCLANVPDRYNCGRCEKCVRTKLELMAIGELQNTDAFDGEGVTVDMLDAFRITIRHRDFFYSKLVEPLRDRGHDELAAAIARKLAAGR